jgi:hypothetical protein
VNSNARAFKAAGQQGEQEQPQGYMGPHPAAAAQLIILQSIGCYHNITQTRKESNDHSTPNKGSLPFPFQPTYYPITAVYDLQLYGGLTGAGVLVLGYLRPGLAHGFKNRPNRQKSGGWFLQK